MTDSRLKAPTIAEIRAARQRVYRATQLSYKERELLRVKVNRLAWRWLRKRYPKQYADTLKYVKVQPYGRPRDPYQYANRCLAALHRGEFETLKKLAREELTRDL